MNQNISRLCGIAGKSTRLIIGLMSGTSLDGLDVALCRFTGSGPGTRIELLAFQTCSYDTRFKEEIRAVFSKRNIDLEQLCLLNGWVAQQHAAMILQCLDKWKVKPEEVDLIASHGQTIYHAPPVIAPAARFWQCHFTDRRWRPIGGCHRYHYYQRLPAETHCSGRRRCTIGGLWRLFYFQQARREPHHAQHRWHRQLHLSAWRS